ncbi:MAG: hypothetical protein KatS3mg068_1650 [Candidatus Sericytochromatia bacterium]|nr:MAG: hypothetical protein KatS3mg068_1650 [Candidatus Sericytochromatia bacterium]
MKKIISSILGFLVLSACNTQINENLSLDNEDLSIQSNNSFKVVQIKLKNSKDLVNLATKGLDLFGFDSKSKTIKAKISTKEEQDLKASKYDFSPVAEVNMSSRGLLPGYMTYNEMKNKLKQLADFNPDIATLNDIGDTWEKTQGKSPNNDIWCLTITNKKVKNQKPASLFIGGMHARELAPPEIMYKLAEYLVKNYGKDSQVTELVDTRDINIVPMVNVDGRIKVEQGNNWQRKNTHGTGVDLNRNFDSYWNYQGLDVPSSWIGSSTNPNSETYSGTAPASEPEVQAIQNYYKVKKLNLVLDMHSYGEMFFWPVGYSDKPIPEVNIFKNIYENSFKKIGYQGGTSMTLLYPTTGTTDDYAYVKHKALGLGMEIGQSFRPSYQEVESMWNELRPNLLYLIKVSNTTLTRK